MVTRRTRGRIVSRKFEKTPDCVHCLRVSAKKIRLFIKPYCPWCQRAMRWLDERGIKYDAVDVIASEDAYDEMIRLSGQELAPVIDVDGKILADFGPEELAKFWEEISHR